jgi:hypothetical protein
MFPFPYLSLIYKPLMDNNRENDSERSKAGIVLAEDTAARR